MHRITSASKNAKLSQALKPSPIGARYLTRPKKRTDMDTIKTYPDLPNYVCPCGKAFTLIDAKGIRFRGGNFLNSDVADHSTNTDSCDSQVQCPHCLLWFSVEEGQ